MENDIFIYRYSAKNHREVERIRQKYLPVEESRLERLKRLDRTVQNAGRVSSLSIGVVGALLLGIGLCFGLDVLAGADWLTLLFGTLGVLVMLPAYPICKSIARRKREKLAPEILRLSEEIMNASADQD